MATIETTAQGRDPSGIVTARALIVVGGGEHARVVAEAAQTRPEAWRVIGYTDPAVEAAGIGEGIVRIGDDAALLTMLAATPTADRPAIVLGFWGSATARRTAAARLAAAAEWASIVHVAAWVSPSATIGPGAVIMAGATVNAGARIGAHAIVNSGAVVEHDVVIAEGSHVGPAVVIGGGAQLGEDVSVGLGAAIRDHVIVGDRATIGMGAVVVRDVDADTTVMGNPARVRSVIDG